MSDPKRSHCCGGVYCDRIESCTPWPCDTYEPQLKLFDFTCECGHSQWSHRNRSGKCHHSITASYVTAEGLRTKHVCDEYRPVIVLFPEPTERCCYAD